MIKATELRIGNLVNDYGMMCPVTPLMLSRLYEINNSGMKSINLTPLELTEDWLIKFGLGHQKELKRNIFISENRIRDGSGRFDDYIISVKNSATTLGTIKYVHQLQNLYFALTGQELTLDPSREL